jgi:hypothetical protein
LRLPISGYDLWGPRLFFPLATRLTQSYWLE